MGRIRQINKTIWSSNIPLVIGYFSCIHVMHAQLLTKFHNFNVLTFNDFSSKKNNAIYSFDQRINNIQKYKPENIYVLDINKNNMTALQFIKSVLIPMNPSQIVVGEDFRFGSDHKNVQFLRNYFKVETIKYNKRISTTIIVRDLKSNKLVQANDFLDEPYYYQSKWVAGRNIGKVIGFKTINLLPKDNLLLKDGSYITKIQIGKKTYQSISFLGTSKTTGSLTRTLETHVLHKNIAPRRLFPSSIKNNIKVSFLSYIRPNKNFKDAKLLTKQIHLDQQFAIKYFKENI